MKLLKLNILFQGLRKIFCQSSASLAIALLLLGTYTQSPYSINANEGKKSVGSISSNDVQASSSDVVEMVEPNDPFLKEQWALSYIENLRAWRVVKQKRQIKVAVVDTGVDYNHPDLKNKVLKNEGYDFHNGDRDAMDDSWHGTHIAGVIAAEANNGIGISGVTGELDVKIIPVKVAGSGGLGSAAVMAEGIKYAVDKGADIINFSITFKTRDEFIQEALIYARSKGVFVVTAAGNNNEACDNISPTADPGAYTVAAVNPASEKTPFSNYGSVVKVSAPGSGILSTIPGESYQYRDGTSMAAPMVSGIAAILKAENPDLSPEELGEAITESALADVITLDKQPIGKGTVNAVEALKRIKY